MCNPTSRPVRANIIVVEKQLVAHIVSLCVCMCVYCRLRYPKHRVRASSVACMTPQYFPTLSHKRHDFRKTITEHKMCVLLFSTTAA